MTSASTTAKPARKRATSARKKTTSRARKSATSAAAKRKGGSRGRGKAAAPSETMLVVPTQERLAIDKALILEQPPLDSIEAVYEKHELGERYGVGVEAFGTYAKSVLEVHAMGYADRLTCDLLSECGSAGRENRMDLMTSRVAERIARLLVEDGELSVSDLARVAASAASLRRAVTQAERSRRDFSRAEAKAKAEECQGGEKGNIRRAVRELYGLDMPAVSPADAGDSTEVKEG